MPRTNTPDIVEVNSQQLDELLDRAASNTLREEDTELLRQIFDSYVHFFEIVGDKNSTIGRLRKFLFGDSSEKASKLLGEDDQQEPSTGSEDDTDSDSGDTNANAAANGEPPPGHGRYSADDYPARNR